ncbi:MAG: hypothetical protein AAF944_05510 [Bacteroidota bacterium]
MQLPITYQSLESMASAESFARGEDYYYQDYVESIKFNGQQFTAKVLGTHPYRVEISGTPTDTYTHCSCPYDWGGICKHIVAVGLAILDGKFEDESDDYEDTVAEENAFSLKNFSDVYKRTEDTSKLQFLQQLLSQNTPLQTQFVKYVAAQQQRSVEALLDENINQIEQVKEEVQVMLESLSFTEEEIFPPGYYENGGYYDEWEDAVRGAEKIIAEALSGYLKKARHYFQQGELVKGLSRVLGTYEAAFSVSYPAKDPLEIIDEYSENVQRVLKKQLTDLFQSMSGTVLAEIEVEAAIDLLFARYQHYENRPASSSPHSEEIYYLKDFELFLKTILVDPSVARFVWQRLREEDLVDVDTAHVVLHIAERLSDDALWLRTAEEFLDFDDTLALPLLDKLHQLDGDNAFLDIAQRAFRNFPEKTARYLSEKLSPDDDLTLYKAVYSHLVQHGNQTAYYQTIRPHLTLNEKNRLIQSVKPNDIKYVQLLAVEERYEDILQHVRQRIDQDYHFEKLIEPILTVYPGKCFVILEQKCWRAMEQRGRAIYRMIARWLQLMQQIPSHRDEADALAWQLYHHKPNLPALRDEMRKAQVVSSR